MTESGEELSVPFNGRINYCGLSVAVKLKINLSCPHGALPINVPGTVNKTVIDVYFILSNITLSHKHVRVSAQESILQSRSMFAPICPISISESTYFWHTRIWTGSAFFFSFRHQILSNVHLIFNAHLKSSAEYSSYLSVWVEHPPLAAAPFYRPLWTLLDGVLHKAGFHWVHLEK